ncbi:hypothetical protein GCM10009680_20040 [Streptomyces yatensis]|uniref:Uncharacterized protein n=1 Tax=Streptomyces yatensis TaxID=155177 RepID=A0ABN2H2K4_9ACTN
MDTPARAATSARVGRFPWGTAGVGGTTGLPGRGVVFGRGGRGFAFRATIVAQGAMRGAGFYNVLVMRPSDLDRSGRWLAYCCSFSRTF